MAAAGFVLTLQTRGTAYPQAESYVKYLHKCRPLVVNGGHLLALLGKEGLREVALQCAQKAHYTAEQITALPGWELLFAVRTITSLPSRPLCLGPKSMKLSWMRDNRRASFGQSVSPSPRVGKCNPFLA